MLLPNANIVIKIRNIIEFTEKYELWNEHVLIV